METHSNKTTYKLTVLKPDTTYQVKVLTQCLSKLHKTNEVFTVRTPEGCEFSTVGTDQKFQLKTTLLTDVQY